MGRIESSGFVSGRVRLCLSASEKRMRGPRGAGSRKAASTSRVLLGSLIDALVVVGTGFDSGTATLRGRQRR